MKIVPLLAFLGLGLLPTHADEAKRPNILFIAIDDLRPALGCYGMDWVQSPHIDAIAAKGVRFERAYCQAPHCLPSRASLLSGVHPATHKGLPMELEELAPGKATLPQTFRKAGYHTVGNGKIYHHVDDHAELSWSEPPFSLVNGPKDNNHITFHHPDSGKFISKTKGRGPFFEAAEVDDQGYIDAQTADKTIADLKRLAKGDKPFFLACGFVRPHLPFYAPKSYWDLYDADKIPLADNRFAPKNAPKSLKGSREIFSYHLREVEYNSDEFHRIGRHGYYACVSYVDAQVGRLMATLDELGLADNTIVVVWGDHGWHLGEHNFWGKHNLLDTAIRVPLIIHAPGHAKGQASKGIVELVDLYPTLCELAGIEAPAHLDGRSVVPQLKNPAAAGKGSAVTKWREGVVLTTEQFLYTEYKQGERMLYDLKQDPQENRNVFGDPAYQATAKRLAAQLKARLSP